MTYAVIRSGGKQYRVEKGTDLLVDRLSAKEGDDVSLEPLAYRDRELITDPKALSKLKVQAKVTEHLRGPKLRIFKYKPKKGYRRRAGHRSELTRLEVTDLRMLTRAPASGAKRAASKPAQRAKPSQSKARASQGKARSAAPKRGGSAAKGSGKGAG